MRGYLPVLFVIPSVFAMTIGACVADDPATEVGTNSDGGTNDGTNDGTTNGDGNTSPTDGSPSDATSVDGGIDSGITCGYGGLACCKAPLLLCNQGTACVSGTCKANDVWVLGTYPNTSLQNVGASAHFDGTAWTVGGVVPLGAGGSDFVTSAFGFLPSLYQATNDLGIINELSGSAWETCGSPAGCHHVTPLVTLQAIYGFGISDYWIGGVNTMIQCTAGGCAPAITGLPGSFGGVGNFTGTSSSDLWFTQTSTAYHYDGAAWTGYSSLTANAIWAVAKGDVWVGGNDSQLQHFDGTSWSSVFQINEADAAVPGNIYGMSGSGPDDIWAAGYNPSSNLPFSLHWTGAAWSFVPVPAASAQASSVYAAGKNDDFLSVGNSVLHFDGAAWTAMTMPPSSDYPGVFAPGVTPTWTVVIGTSRARP